MGIVECDGFLIHEVSCSANSNLVGQTLPHSHGDAFRVLVRIAFVAFPIGVEIPNRLLTTREAGLYFGHKLRPILNRVRERFSRLFFYIFPSIRGPVKLPTELSYSVPELSMDGFRFCSFNDWYSQSFSIDRKSGFTLRNATAIPVVGREYRTVAVASNI